jgi:ketosteroid isomerase-like protein
MQYYWKSPDTEFVGAGGINRGWDAVLARYRKGYPDAKAMGQLSFSDLEIKMLCPDVAYAMGEFHLVREKDHPSGVFTVIVKKFPEGWRIIHDHSTAFPAEAK